MRGMVNAYFLVGEVLKPQGVRGEAKVKPYAANPEDFKHWKTLYVKHGETYAPLSAHTSRVHDGFGYVTLEGCPRMEDVERLSSISIGSMPLPLARARSISPIFWAAKRWMRRGRSWAR